MPRYFFHLHNHIECIDHEGAELPGTDAVRAHAVHTARDVMAENIRQGEICLSHRIEVVDGSGAPVLTLRFADALSVTP
jgi:hypothetical protein